ncbi:MAG: hypothetical protein KAQ62_09410, partial [Cyclobacteriaceae bacterium]|nr:hypothetical protein [Cyclobacteriaceae bacterium]
MVTTSAPMLDLLSLDTLSYFDRFSFIDERSGILVVFFSPVIVAFSLITGFVGAVISSFRDGLEVFSSFGKLTSVSDFRLFFLSHQQTNSINLQLMINAQVSLRSTPHEGAGFCCFYNKGRTGWSGSRQIKDRTNSFARI